MLSENLFLKIDSCLMIENTPSYQLRVFAQQVWFKKQPFALLLQQIKTGQSPVYHPEGNVWNHTLMVVDEAAKRKQYSQNPRVLMWAALLHDVGKPAVTKIRRGRITAYDHDKVGEKLAEAFLFELTEQTDFIAPVTALVRYHMQPLYVEKSLPFQDIAGLKRCCDVREVALLSYCDRLGRLGADTQAETQATKMFLKKCGERTDLPWLKPE